MCKFTLDLLQKAMDKLSEPPGQKYLLITENEIRLNWKHGILPDPSIPDKLKESPEVMIEAIKNKKLYYRFGFFDNMLVVLSEFVSCL